MNPEAPAPLFGVDPFLQRLARMADGGIEITLTLCVGGMLVTGVTTSTRAYFEAFGEGFTGGMPQGEGVHNQVNVAVTHARIKEQFAAFAEQTSAGPLIDFTAESAAQQETFEALAQGPAPQFIHLRNAQMFGPGASPIPPQPTLWWRGRLSAVDGYVLGQVSIG